MNAEEKVKAQWPDAGIMSAFAVQPDKTRKWMYCVESSLKFLLTRKRKNKPRVTNIGEWRFSEAEAWEDAANKLE